MHLHEWKARVMEERDLKMKKKNRAIAKEARKSWVGANHVPNLPSARFLRGGRVSPR